MLAIKLALLLLLLSGPGDNPVERAEKLIAKDKYTEAEAVLRKINVASLNKAEQARYHFLYGNVLASQNREDKALQRYLKAKQLYLAADSAGAAMDINPEISYLLSAQENYGDRAEGYLTEYLEYARRNKDPLRMARAYSAFAASRVSGGNYKEAIRFFRLAAASNKIAQDERLESVMNNNLAVLYNENLHKPDSALYYLDRDLPYLQKINDVNGLCHNYVNRAAAYYYKGDHRMAIRMLESAESLPITDNVLKTKQYINEFLYVNYEALKDYTNAFKHLSIHKQLADSANGLEQNIALKNIETQYKVREKVLENNVLKSRAKVNLVVLYSVAGLLAITLALGYLIVKNARRRERISRQEKLIEQQKLEKALKEYELSSIDMMLEGQEKERQRIANDLHDNLGSMLATLKLNFENLKLRKNELRDEENKLYQRTDELIEEAYQKVRRLAHAKNAGVFANEGLIPALEKLADKISIPGKLAVHVVHFGFNERLENALEIAIFRMVQELATNVIKHAHATEATLHLTHHDDNINIIIEDNGAGFDPENINAQDGMGLAAIRKKTTQLGGTLQIDATPGKGTTIVIDIPV